METNNNPAHSYEPSGSSQYRPAPPQSSQAPQEKPRPVKRWRVGSLSMAVALLGAGLYYLLQPWLHMEVFSLISMWWPVIFILLGCEILIYVILVNKENVRLQYDILSIFFVGILGTICLGLMTLSSTGILQEIQHAVGSTQQSASLPELNYSVSPQVKKVVVETNQPHRVHIDSTSDKNVHVFGEYRSDNLANEKSYMADAVQMKEVGDTLYVLIKEPPRKRFYDRGGLRLSLTIALPNTIKSEIRGWNG